MIEESEQRAPRRLGHVVLATPHLQDANSFYLDGLGFKVSDKMLDGVLTFMRVEPDHHNLLIQPGPVTYLNHYAVEMDDIDAIGMAGTAVVAERADASVVGDRTAPSRIEPLLVSIRLGRIHVRVLRRHGPDH